MKQLNTRFSIPRVELEERVRTSFSKELSGYDLIVPLREIVTITHMAFMRNSQLEALLRSIPLRSPSHEKIFPYRDSRIQIFGIEPKGVAIGQTFVLRSKLLGIMSQLNLVFEEYITKGISKMPPAQIYGGNTAGERVMAFYLPPLIEQHNGGFALLDGIHRSYLCSSAGTSINAVQISLVGAPLPFDPIEWKEVQVVDEKPPIPERYRNLRTDYFRDLTYVGIDG